MSYWLSAMSHDDGEISFFNDSAFYVASSNNDLMRYAADMHCVWMEGVKGVTKLTESGYICISNSGTKVIFDIAEVGASYIPGHAHADTLSFEFSHLGQRIFVNSGTSTYERSDLRHFQRSTKAHNTVTVNNENSSEVWESFRVGERANITEHRITQKNNKVSVSATHNGFKKIYGGPLHTRTIRACDRVFEVQDSLSKKCKPTANFYLRPSVKVYLQDKYSGKLILKDGKQLSWSVEGAGPVIIGKAFWYPGFGLRHCSHRISFSMQNSTSLFKLFLN